MGLIGCMSVVSVLLFLIIAENSVCPFLFSSKTCTTKYPEKCECKIEMYEGAEKLITRCINSNFNDSSVLKRLPGKTQVLIFTGNNITFLPSNAFGKSSLFQSTYKKLDIVDLSNNNIVMLGKGAFNHIPSVKRLILNDNQLVVNNVNYFQNMNALKELYLNFAFHRTVKGRSGSTIVSSDVSIKELTTLFKKNPLNNLNTLYLEQNGISHLDMSIFCPIPNLSNLYLAGNNIDKIVWKKNCLKALSYIDLRNNHIPYLKKSIIVQLETSRNMTVDLSGNPFVCDCYMEDFYNWLHTTNVIIVNKQSYICEAPSENANKSIMELPYSKLKCKGIAALIWKVVKFFRQIQAILRKSYKTFD